ncbi:MAG: M43 family zinc metalloprotease [Bacteroidia bacterium]
MRKISLMLLALAATVTVQAQRVCGSMEHLSHQIQEDPSLVQRMESIEEHTAKFEKANPNGQRVVITIPTVVHVVWRTGKAVENISDAQVQSQIDVLNADFRKLNADASLIPAAFSGVAVDYEIQFCLAKRTPTGAATNGIVHYQKTRNKDWGTNNDVKKPTRGGVAPWDATKYLNIWVCSIGGGILGYAQFPGGSVTTDGVVLDYRYTGTTGTATSPYHLGRTATHEVGHWLNLRHIWGDATCGSDLVGDTPTHNTANYGCPSQPHLSTCTGTPREMTMNYMDYTDDACMYMFSAGQKTRSQALFASGGSRVGLLTSLGCQIPSATPVIVMNNDGDTYGELAEQPDFGTIRIVEDAPVMSIYPNPTKDNITVSLLIDSPLSHNVSLSILDQMGRNVRTIKHTLDMFNSEVNLDMSDLANGLYYIQYNKEGVLATEKVVLQR